MRSQIVGIDIEDLEMIENDTKSLKRKLDRGMITEEQWQSGMKEMEEQKKKLVLGVHKHTISAYTTNEKDRNERTRWSTRVPGENGKLKWIRANSEDELYEKLFDFYNPEKQPKKEPPTLANAYPRWIEVRKAKQAGGTADKDIANWKRYYEGEDIIHIPLTEIKASEISKWIGKRIRELCLTQRQYVDMTGIWRSIEDFLIKDDYPIRRLVKGMAPPSKTLFRDLPVRYAEIETLFPDECDQMRAVLRTLYDKSHFNTAYLGIILTTYLGVRVGELCCLRWDGIDDAAGVINVTQSESPNFVEENGHLYARGYKTNDHLKSNHRNRYVALVPAAKRILNEIKKENFKHGVASSEYIFVERDGRRKHARSFQKAILKAYEVLGWKGYKKGGVHEFRRTYITEMRGNIPDAVLVKRTGHKDISTIDKHYDFGRRIPSQAEIDRTAEILGGF